MMNLGFFPRFFM